MPDPCFLPHLRPEHAAPIPTAGDGVWTSQGGGVSTLAKYADALRVDQAGIRAERLKSVPTPWARLLLFEQALFEPRHPVHAQVLGEWRGLLGCLALAPYLQVGVRTVSVSLDHASGAVKALRQMAPGEGDSALWDSLALIYVQEALVGGTSPRTLVFTGMRNTVPSDVPFQRAGRFRDPTEYYRSLASPQPAL